MADRKRPEILVGEVRKNRSDAWRISVRSHREGRLIAVGLVHRFAGGEIEVQGKGLAVRPDQIEALTAALREAAALATSERASEALEWLVER